MEQARTQTADAGADKSAADAETDVETGIEAGQADADEPAPVAPEPQGGQPETQAPEDRLEELLSENERLREEAQQGLERALRAGAELDNVRKRAARDVENAHKYALERFVNELLPVLDSMELGINASRSAADVESLREGMCLTQDKLSACLDKFGIRAIDPAGEKFDPKWHEAVSMQEHEDAVSGQVVIVMQKGYDLNGRLLRPAMVVVAK